MLRAIAAMIQTTVRRTDMVARYGGEEFSVILPNTNQEDAWQLAERIRRAVEGMHSTQRKVTVSIGVAARTEEMVNSEHFLALADEALYEAKNKGRNQISVSGER